MIIGNHIENVLKKEISLTFYNKLCLQNRIYKLFIECNENQIFITTLQNVFSYSPDFLEYNDDPSFNYINLNREDDVISTVR